MATGGGTIEQQLLQYAPSLPEAERAQPWGHDLAKVRGKTFAFFGGEAGEAGQLSLTVKLPIWGEMALALPECQPAGYGLGKSGWVAFRSAADATVDLEMLESWIRQSYRAIAPKKLSALVPHT